MLSQNNSMPEHPILLMSGELQYFENCNKEHKGPSRKTN